MKDYKAKWEKLRKEVVQCGGAYIKMTVMRERMDKIEEEEDDRQTDESDE